MSTISEDVATTIPAIPVHINDAVFTTPNAAFAFKAIASRIKSFIQGLDDEHVGAVVEAITNGTLTLEL